jgi:putative ABC transport system permease protein
MNAMFSSYFKTAFRNLVRNRFSSMINIGGLAVGMGVAMLIGLWVTDELSFDKSHSHYNRIAQVYQNVTNNGEVQTVPVVPYPLANELRKNYGSDFTTVAMTGGRGPHIISHGDKHLSKKGSYFEPQGPSLLDLHMVQGNLDGLKNPASILLSESAAKAIFGNSNPMDQSLKIDNRMDVKVTGVYEDLPFNSSFTDLEFIAPWDLYFANTEWIRTAEDPWRPNAFQILVQLAENADMANVSLKIKDERLKNVNEQLAKKKPELFLQPMSKWHLSSEFKNGVNVGGRIRYVWLFGTIGIFVLLLACINFMNLSTARSERRAREVGIRKAIGSLRRQLIGQFLAESILVAFFSFILCFAFVQGLLPFFNGLSEKQMAIPWGNPLFWILGLVFTLITGLLAGSYPAFYFSSFRPVRVLKGTFRTGKRAAIPRKALVVLQFTVSITMIIGTLIVFKQIQHSRNRPMGYESNGLINIPLVGEDVHKHFNVVRDELIQAGAILSMAEAGNPTTEVWGTSSGFNWKGKDPNLSVDFPRIDISYDYGKTVGLEFIAGRDFSRDFATDSSALIINETAARFMGLTSPIGETIHWFDQPYTVVGVVKDMVMQSPYEQVKPTVYNLYSGAQNVAILKLNPSGSAKDALAKIESVFKKISPIQPFEYQFVDEAYAQKFGNEKRVGKLAGFFAILAILISCLGLLGMVSFVAEKRTKEIGVRKVLGASVFNVWNLLSKEFVVLVVISVCISIPLAYYFMHTWLQNFDYRTGIPGWIFIAGGAVVLLLTLMTVSFQAIKAALTDPVKSLRSE